MKECHFPVWHDMKILFLMGATCPCYSFRQHLSPLQPTAGSSVKRQDSLPLISRFMLQCSWGMHSNVVEWEANLWRHSLSVWGRGQWLSVVVWAHWRARTVRASRRRHWDTSQRWLLQVWGLKLGFCIVSLKKHVWVRREWWRIQMQHLHNLTATASLQRCWAFTAGTFLMHIKGSYRRPNKHWPSTVAHSYFSPSGPHQISVFVPQTSQGCSRPRRAKRQQWQLQQHSRWWTIPPHLSGGEHLERRAKPWCTPSERQEWQIQPFMLFASSQGFPHSHMSMPGTTVFCIELPLCVKALVSIDWWSLRIHEDSLSGVHWAVCCSWCRNYDYSECKIAIAGPPLALPSCRKLPAKGVSGQSRRLTMVWQHSYCIPALGCVVNLAYSFFSHLVRTCLQWHLGASVVFIKCLMFSLSALVTLLTWAEVEVKCAAARSSNRQGTLDVCAVLRRWFTACLSLSLPR